jgi:hypothetical protein
MRNCSPRSRRLQRETNVHFERAYRLVIKSLGTPVRAMRLHAHEMTRAAQAATRAIEQQLLEDVL